MISTVMFKNFKGQTGEYLIAPKMVIIGPNGSGKTRIAQAIQLAIHGNRNAGAVLDAFAGDERKVYVEATVLNDAELPTQFGRQYCEKNGSNTQVLMLDRKESDPRAFDIALGQAGAPVVVDVDAFLTGSHRVALTTMASIAGQADIEELSKQLDARRETLNQLRTRKRENEAIIGKLAEAIAQLEATNGTLPEIRNRIKTTTEEIIKARGELRDAEKSAAEAQKAAEDAKRAQDAAAQPAQPPTITPDQGAGAAPGVFDMPQPAPPKPLAAVDNEIMAARTSVQKIIDAIEAVACPACKGGFALMTAKVELKKLGGKHHGH